MAIVAIGEGTSKVRRCWLFVLGEWGRGYADLVQDIGYAERLGKVVTCVRPFVSFGTRDVCG
jgi:hypothetical protein